MKTSTRSLLNHLREEDGIAMMVVVVVSVVGATLAMTALAVSTHSDKAQARGQNWVQALDVAESGVDEAIARVEAANGAFSGTFTGSTDQGTYSVTVTRQARNRYTVDSTGTVNAGLQLEATRRIQVNLAPPQSFKSALFAYTSVVTKNGDEVTGDIWANQNVVIDANTLVHGSVTAATGYVSMGNGAEVDKDVWTGGFNPATNKSVEGTTIGGNAKASVVNPPDPITCGGADPSKYTIAGGTIAGNATTWGTVTSTVSGAASPNICTSAPATVAMPTFTYNAANYDAATLHEFGTPSISSATAAADAQAWLTANKTSVSGTIYVNQTAPVSQDNRLDLSGVIFTGDTNFISNVPIYTGGATDNTSDAIVMLASTYQPPAGSICDVNHDGSDCAIHLKNQFSVSGNTAVLAYAPYGPVAVKNNAIQFGAIYADSMDIKNNQEMTYDPRVDRMVGFGEVTLDIVRWLELKP